jgi:hypothetical protein
MSEATKTALEAALQAHVQDEAADDYPQLLVSGYVAKVHFIDMSEDDNTSHFYFIRPDTQAYHETYGLLLTAQDDFVAAAMDDEE